MKNKNILKQNRQLIKKVILIIAHYAKYIDYFVIKCNKLGLYIQVGVEVRKNTFIFNYKEFTYFIYKFIAPTCSEFVFPSPLTSITPIDFTDLSWIF